MAGVADEAPLIARIAAGDTAALRELFARHHIRVYRFILRLVRNPAPAEELTNEVFLEVWRNAGRFEGASSAITWMLSIAHHRAVSSLRKRRDQGWDERAAAGIPDTADDPEVAAQKIDKSTGQHRRHQVADRIGLVVVIRHTFGFAGILRASLQRHLLRRKRREIILRDDVAQLVVLATLLRA